MTLSSYDVLTSVYAGQSSLALQIEIV